MKIYKLFKEDLNQIELLIKTTTFIDKLYNKLYELEINGNKETEEYIETIKCLNKNICYENAIYDDLTYENCIAYFKYIYSTEITNTFLSDRDSLLEQNYSNRIIRRILSTLNFKILSNPVHLQEILEDKIKNYVSDLDDENANSIIERSANVSIQIKNSLDKDLLNMYLSILEDFINNNNYQIFKNKLINSKYNLSFTNKETEKNLVNNNFTIPKEIYIVSTFVTEINGIPQEVYEALTNLYVLETIKEQMIAILEIGDMDYSNVSKATTSILRQSLMRAAISLLSENNLSSISSIFEEHTKSKSYINNHSFDNISKELIASSLQNIKIDRNKQRTLSLSNGKRY